MTVRLSIALVVLACVARGAEAPELPRYVVDTRYVPAACTTTVASGGNLQTAINNAVLGDTLCLEAGATFTGNFTLPNKGAGSSYITIRTATTDANFPRPGTRVAPANASLMSKIISGTTNVIKADNDAHHYRFMGIELTSSAFITTIVNLESDTGTQADLTSYFIFDRCYIHGNATNGARRGIGLQSSWVGVVDSYLSDFKEVGGDAQAIAGWNGPGPFKIENNYLEGSTENVLFGGVDPTIADLVPSDIEIRRNRFAKPLTWKADDPSYLGTLWQVKNLLELKNAQRVLIENNLFEYCWAQAQDGNAILFTVKNQDNTAPWSVIKDVMFRKNIVRHANVGLKLSGYDPTYAAGSAISYRVQVSDNLFDDIGTAEWGGGTIYLYTLLAPTYDLVVENNTSFQSGSIASIDRNLAAADHTDSLIRYNITPQDSFGVKGSGFAVGTATLDEFFASYSFTGNVLQGTDNTATYPSGQNWPAAMSNVGFVNLGGGNYRLDPSSSYDGIGPGGRDLGAFFPAAGQSWLDLEVQATGTSAVLRFGRQGLAATASCTVRYGSASTTSNSGGSRRYVVLTGLTNAQQYAFSVDCGDVDGDIADSLFTAATPSGGNRSIPISLRPAAILATAARVTVDYGTTSAVSDGSVQNTSCGSGCTVTLSLPAGVHYWRPRWQTSADVVIATGTPQPLPVP